MCKGPCVLNLGMFCSSHATNQMSREDWIVLMVARKLHATSGFSYDLQGTWPS